MVKAIEKIYESNYIPIVFTTDDNFVPYLYISIKSMLENSSKDKNYDIVILNTNLNNYNKQRLSEFSNDNISIRFVEMSEYMDQHKEHWYTHWGYSEAVYYRFFIPQIFEKYKKVLFLDGDIIVNCDISDLYNIDLKDKFIGAVQDLPRQLEGDMFIDYITNSLKMDRKNYFNAGILLLDLEKIATMDFFNSCMSTLKELNKPLLQDQDVFNVIFKDKVFYLDITYNLSWNLLHFYSDIDTRLPQDIYEAYIETWKQPKIVHYAGSYKPWKQPWLEHSEYFWQYARQTTFYEEIIYKNCKAKVNRNTIQNAVQHKKIYLNYFKCKILSFLTFGKAKEHYMEKKERLKVKVRDYRQTIRRKL